MTKSSMYRWRRMSAEQRAEVLQCRQQHQVPWHSPPHYTSETNLYLITAACYEHRPVIGHSIVRMTAFEHWLLGTANGSCTNVYCWTVLPNHYHLLVETTEVKNLLLQLGRLHGRTSFQWNGEESCRRRKVWCNAAETGMKSERHYWASFVYVLHNAVKHGYVSKWQDWPFCNARAFLENEGIDRARHLWQEYPINDYGTDWDPADM